jgi:ABC-2 type transport system ATP-binding protein
MIRPAAERDAAIVLRGVHKQFGATKAVDGIDLVVPRGSVCGFLGPNGAGKSTSIRMIMSIIYPDRGDIRVLGGSALESKDRIGYLPEERGLYRTMRVLEFLVYMGRLKGLDGATATKRATDWLERIDLPGQAKKRCHELSKGMQQKVQFISSVMHAPELLILDEPFSGLDPTNARLLATIVDELHRGGTTIIFSTHQMHTAERLCDRVVLINHGRVLLDATLAEVRSAFDPRMISVAPLRPSPQDAAVLRGLPGVVAVQADEDAEDEWLLRIDERHDPHEAMRAALSALPLRSVALQSVTLDDVFFRLVDASGGAAPIASTARRPSADPR